jgi:hypothetical protein
MLENIKTSYTDVTAKAAKIKTSKKIKNAQKWSKYPNKMNQYHNKSE